MDIKAISDLFEGQNEQNMTLPSQSLDLKNRESVIGAFEKLQTDITMKMRFSESAAIIYFYLYIYIAFNAVEGL